LNVCLRLALTLYLIFALSIGPAAAQGLSVIRDAELEDFMRDISAPIFEAGGQRPQDVDIVIINDPALNAFYAGGQRIFIHTGLILETENVNQVIGVMAHENGHMTAGHVQRFDEALKPASSISILSLLLGAAAIAAGAPEAGMGILGGGQTVAQRNVLSFRRVQEASADQAAAEFLRKAELSGQGLIEVFEKFRYQELLSIRHLDPFVITHPLSSQRIANLSSKLKASPYWDKPPDPEHQARYERVKAKLEGYVLPAKSTLGKYPPSDTSVKARYARVYAYNKALEWDKAMAEADSLIADYPDDPFFQEVKGQMLLENGKVDKSLPHLEKAVELAPREPLIMTLYGQALVAKESSEHFTAAINVLDRATQLDPNNAFAWYQLAIAYTRTGQTALANLASAEYALLTRQPQKAAQQASLAARDLTEGTPKWYRARDIQQIIGSAMIDGADRRRR